MTRSSVKSMCNMLAIVCFSFGTIGSIVLAYVLGNRIDFITDYGTTYYERDWEMTWSVFIGSFLSILVLCAILLALVKILELKCMNL